MKTMYVPKNEAKTGYRDGSEVQVTNIKRQAAIRDLMDHPQYFQLRSEDRLNMVRMVQDGMSLSTVRYFLTVRHWVQTGLIFEEKGSKKSD